jgi:tetratricopeptide (TPR) repeat protein
MGHQMEKALQAFTRAITADPQYIQPYVDLATLELQAGQFESAVETAGKALELNPGIVSASFLQAVANFKLNRLDAADKNAHDAEKGLHQNIPQVHLLLADIFLKKRDYSSAAEQMRTYLKEAPQGQFASETEQSLEQIEKTGRRRRYAHAAADCTIAARYLAELER